MTGDVCMEASGGSTTAKQVTFGRLCDLFDELMEASSKGDKEKVYMEFVKYWYSIESTNKSMFQAVRILVPKQDIRCYGTGSTKLAQSVARAISLKPNALNYTTGKKVKDGIDLLVTAYRKKRGGSSKKITLHDLNEALDDIFLKKNIEREKGLSGLFIKMDARELKFLFHMLTDELPMTIGIFGTAILDQMDKSFAERMSVGECLEEVLKDYDPARLKTMTDKNQVYKTQINRPFYVMKLSKSGASKEEWDEFCKVTNSTDFVIEEKFDGEHMIVHRTEEGKYRFYSRNRNNYTECFGSDPSTIAVEGTPANFTKDIDPFFREDVKDVILDCELTMVLKADGSPVPKGYRVPGGDVFDVKYVKEHYPVRRQLVVFDVIHYNHNSLVDVPFKYRRKVLEDFIFKDLGPKNDVVVIPKQVPCNNYDTFEREYKKEMGNKKEGIVVKWTDARYVSGSRAKRNGFFKCKPDYAKSCTLDLAVVGVKYRNANSPDIVSFKMAAMGENNKLKIVGNVDANMKALDIKRLKELLSRNDRKFFQDTTAPIWLAPGSESEMKSIEWYVDRNNIAVVEVASAGIINGHLHFAKFKFIRHDKNIEDIDTIEDVAMYDDQLRDNEAEFEKIKHGKILKQLTHNELSTKRAKMTKTSSVFSDITVCVLNEDSVRSINDYRDFFYNLGANVVAHPTQKTNLVVGFKEKHVKVEAAIRAMKITVINGDWINECYKEGKLLELDSKYCFWENPIENNCATINALINKYPPVELLAPKKEVFDSQEAMETENGDANMETDKNEETGVKEEEM